MCVFDECEGILAFVLTDNFDVEKREIANLRQNLALHEIPSRFVTVNDFPVNRHQKIDRNALMTLAKPNSDGCIQVFDMLIDIWTNILGCKPCENSNFIEAGGDSFLAVNVVQQLKQANHHLPDNFYEVLIQNKLSFIKQYLHESLSSEPCKKRIKTDRLASAQLPTISKEVHIVTKSKGRTNGILSNYCNPALESESYDFIEKWTVDFEKCIDG